LEPDIQKFVEDIAIKKGVDIGTIVKFACPLYVSLSFVLIAVIRGEDFLAVDNSLKKTYYIQ